MWCNHPVKETRQQKEYSYINVTHITQFGQSFLLEIHAPTNIVPKWATTY